MKRIQKIFSIFFLLLSVFSGYTETLTQEIKKLLIGNWKLYKVKVGRRYKPALNNVKYFFMFNNNGTVIIKEIIKNPSNIRDKININKGSFRVKYKYVYINILNNNKKYRVFSISKKRLILKIKGNNKIPYLYYYLRRQ